MDLTQKLSANFSLNELTKSETALRHGLDNTPPQEVVDNLRTLCENVLQPVREGYGVAVKVNSGYRAPEVNAAVGGSKTSDHCKGQAADIEIPGVPNAELAEWIKDNLDFTQLILEFYTSFQCISLTQRIQKFLLSLIDGQPSQGLELS